jgi:Family of unknown function (DUF6344)
MTGNKVVKLWTVLVTAFVALLAALGFASTAAAASVQQAAQARNCAAAPVDTRPSAAPHTLPAPLTLPPTIKQRIHAEAHGSSPTCRAATTGEESREAAAEPAAQAAPAPAAPDGSRDRDAQGSIHRGQAPGSDTARDTAAGGGTAPNPRDASAAPRPDTGPYTSVLVLTEEAQATARPVSRPVPRTGVTAVPGGAVGAALLAAAVGAAPTTA